MRNPIQDENAGAATYVAPSVKQARRVMTVSNQQKTKSSASQKNILAMSGTLGSALGSFMEDKHKAEVTKAYEQAYFEQGDKAGLSDIQRDLKRTGFSKFIYSGKESPEYRGMLAAATDNAATSMMVEESQYMDDKGHTEEASVYQAGLTKRIRSYLQENFDGAPDAQYEFMKKWQKNSNALAFSHRKEHMAWVQQEARKTFNEGWTGKLTLYKKAIGDNPQLAEDLGKQLVSMKDDGTGISPEARRSAIIEQATAAAQAGDYAAFDLLHKSPLYATLNKKEQTAFTKARTKIDTDSTNIMLAAASALEYAMDMGTEEDVTKALNDYSSAKANVSARNTGTTKYLDIVFGADKVRGNLFKHYEAAVKREHKEQVADGKKFDAVVDEGLHIEQLEWEANYKGLKVSDRRTATSKRIAKVTKILARDDLPAKGRIRLLTEQGALRERINKWDSADQKILDDAEKAKEKKRLSELEVNNGAASLAAGTGYMSDEKKPAVLKTAVTNAVNSLIPDEGIDTPKKIEQLFSNKLSLQAFTRLTKNYSGELGKSDLIKTAVGNLAMKIGETNEANVYTDEQRSAAATLKLLQDQSTALFNASFSSAEDKSKIYHYMKSALDPVNGTPNAAKLNYEHLQANAGRIRGGKLSYKAFGEEVKLSGAALDIGFDVYSKQWELGNNADDSLQITKNELKTMSPVIQGRVIESGGTFTKLDSGEDLAEVMQIISKTYKNPTVDGKAYFASGLTGVLTKLTKNDTTKQGQKFHTLDQLPGVKVSVQNDLLYFQYLEHTATLRRDQIQQVVNEYKQSKYNRTRDFSRY